MISRITGRVAAVDEQAVLLDRDGLCYEVLAPVAALPELRARIGADVTLHTVHFLEGNLAGGNLTPRLLGFLTESDRVFFQLLVTIKGISTRKALRVMGASTASIAAAIARGDERFLTALPEIGKKTAAQIVVKLRGKMQTYAEPTAREPAHRDWTDDQRTAVEIMVRWGDRRPDAERWVAAATQQGERHADASAIVTAAYKVKRGSAGVRRGE
ncbi:MAG: Holliday junction branch migration protein RuvA [Phycisphaerae bacterium]